MDEFDHVIVGNGSKIHAVEPELKDSYTTLCSLSLFVDDQATDSPVTCKRCLERMEKQNEKSV